MLKLFISSQKKKTITTKKCPPIFMLNAEVFIWCIFYKFWKLKRIKLLIQDFSNGNIPLSVINIMI